MQLFGNNPGKEYMKYAVMTASPAELVVMLFDACIKNLKLANISYEENRDVGATGNYLMKAQRIVGELANCLDMNFELSKDLLGIYNFLLSQMRLANARKDMELLPPVISILESMSKTWSAVAKTQRESMIVEC